MSKFLINTSEVTSIAEELSQIITSLSDLSSKISGYDVTFKGNTSKLSSAKKQISNNVTTFCEKVKNTQNYINKSVELHSNIQKNTFDSYLSELAKEAAGDKEKSKETKKSSGSAQSFKKGGSIKNSGSSSSMVGPVNNEIAQSLSEFGMLEEAAVSITSYYTENKNISEEELNKLNGIIIFPETGECIAPINFPVGSDISLNYSNSAIDNKEFKVIMNLKNSAVNSNGMYSVIVASNDKNVVENYKLRTGTIRKIGAEK